MSIDRNGKEYSKQEIIDQLNATIQSEECKPLAKRDIDLIAECVDYLMELEQGAELSQVDLEKEKQKIYEYNNEFYKPKKKFKFKGLLIAACFAVIMLLANFTAMACGVDTIAVLKEFGSRIVEMFTGEKEEFKGITIIKNSKSVKYDSIESFLKAEKLNALYPTKLPDGVEFSCVHVTNAIDTNGTSNDEHKKITYITNSSEISMYFYTIHDINGQLFTNNNLIKSKIGNFDCYVDSTGDFQQFMLIYKNYLYTISVANQKDAITIIENLKEI